MNTNDQPILGKRASQTLARFSGALKLSPRDPYVLILSFFMIKGQLEFPHTSRVVISGGNVYWSGRSF